MKIFLKEKFKYRKWENDKTPIFFRILKSESIGHNSVKLILHRVMKSMKENLSIQRKLFWIKERSKLILRMKMSSQAKKY